MDRTVQGVIPEAVVEAAAKASYNLTHKTQWVQLSQGYKRELMVPTRAALEAAAPHMLAEAWEEGFGYARNESWTPEANPYRPTP